MIIGWCILPLFLSEGFGIKPWGRILRLVFILLITSGRKIKGLNQSQITEILEKKVVYINQVLYKTKILNWCHNANYHHQIKHFQVYTQLYSSLIYN